MSLFLLQLMCCELEREQAHIQCKVPTTLTHISHQKPSAVKTKHLGKLQPGSKLPKEMILCLRGAVSMSCFARGLAQGRDRWVLLPGKQWDRSWVTEQSLGSTQSHFWALLQGEVAPWHCSACSNRPLTVFLKGIFPNNAISWVSPQHSLCLWDSCRDHSCPWCLSAQLCGVFPHLHIYNFQFSSQFTIFSSGQCYAEHLFTVKKEVLEGMEGRCPVFIQCQWFHNKKVTASHD